LVEDNVNIIKSVIRGIEEYNTHAILIVVSNPVDILTYIAKKVSKRPSKKIIGAGTILDTARFRYLLSEKLKVGSQSVHGFILGEHGDSELAAWSTVDIGGKPIHDWKLTKKDRDAIFDRTRCAAYDIIRRKGYTNFGIGLAMTELMESILYNQRQILTVSTVVPAFYGKSKVCLGLPCVVGAKGIEQVIELSLSKEEKAALKKSMKAIEKVIASL